MSVIASRASWAPRYGDGFAVIGTTAWRDVFVHHSVTRVPGGANATVAQEQEHMRLLESIGQNNFGGGISYTVIVFPSGRAYQGHSLDRRGAHTYQRNDSARAICFVGNFEEDTPTNAAINAASNVLAEWRAAGLPSRVTGGHRDVYQTACPGRNLYAALSRIKAENATQEGEDDMTPDELLNATVRVEGDVVNAGKDISLRTIFAWSDNNFADLGKRIDAVDAKVSQGGAAIDYDRLAAKVADRMGDAVADKVADRLAKRLES